MDAEAVGNVFADVGNPDKPGAPAKKAKQKTPEQKAALEDIFAGNQHPDEPLRNQLAHTLGLTIQEVTAWFQNKRRRTKNKVEASAAQDHVQFANGASLAVNPPSGPVSSNPISTGAPNPSPAPAGSPGKSAQSIHVEQSLPPEFESAQEYMALLQLATQELEAERDNAPEVSCFFDDPPSSSAAANSNKRRMSEVAAPRKAARKDTQTALQKQLEEEEKRAKKSALKAEREQAKLDVTLKKEQERRMRESQREKMRAEREMVKHQADEAKAKERREKALAKEHEKQEKAMKRERAKAMREAERRQKLAEKEAMREQAKAQKQKEKMDKKRQRELVKQRKEAEKKRSKTGMSLKLREVDPPDDLEIEMAQLREQAIAQVKAERIDAESGAAEGQLDPTAVELEITRPPFPPAHVTDRLQPAFVGQLAENDCELGGQFMMLWSFVAEFSPVIAFRPISVQHLMEAVQAGSLSEALVNLHVAFIRFIQSEAEIANAIGSVHVGMERMSQTVSRAAGLVSEALSWGLDIASWRAHLNGLTWPEVLRQLALTAGWGPRRCRPARAARAYDDRRLGEDVVEGDDGAITFVWPSRFQPSPAPGEHTMKEACWKVLADMAKTEAEVATAAAGLPVREIARRIESAQLRNNKSSTIVEGSVAGALSRDSLFAYVAPGTYALQAVVAYWRKHKDRLDRKARGEEEPEDEVARAAERAAAAAEAAAEVERVAALERERKKHEEEDDEEEDEDEEDDTPDEGRAWVEKLLHQEYDTLTIEERVEALSDLLHLALDMPSIHSALDRRFEDVERAKRNIRDRAKEERKVRQLEMANKAKRDAAEAEARVAALRNAVLNGEDVEMAAPPEEQGRASTGEAPSTKPSSVEGEDHPASTAADVAAAKLRSELETAQRNEREANSTAAEAHQRESLGRQLHEIELANAIRDEPIGMDRRFNRYRWYGPVVGTERRLLPDRVLFESGETGALQMFTDYKDMEAVRGTLETKGAREAALARTCDFCMQSMAKALRRGEGAAPEAVSLPEGPASWPPEALARLQEAQFARFLRVTTAGMEVLGEDGGVRSTDYLPTDAAAVKKLKTEMLCIESAIPEQAMINPNWDRVSWIKGAQGASSLEQLRQLLGALEHNLQKGWLSPTYIRDPVLVKKAFNPVGREVAAVALASQNECMRLRPADVHPEVNTEPLAWLPATTAGLMLRLLCLDAAVCYSTEQRPWRERLSTYRYVQNPVLLAGKATAEQGSIATVCGLPTYTGVGIFPVLPPALVPVEPVPLKIDAEALLQADDEDLRIRVPAGLKQAKALEAGPATKKQQPKKKAKKRPSDDDDVTRAADIISSDDDFAFDAYTYQYAQAAAGLRDPQETPAASGEDVHDDPNDPEASLSETPDEEEDDADFVG